MRGVTYPVRRWELEKLKMREENKIITIPGEEALEILNELDILVVSLDHIKSHYAISSKVTDEDVIYRAREACHNELADFMVNWKIFKKLAKIRGVLSEKFDDTLGDDDMDDLERAAEGLKYWEKPGDTPD